MSTEFKTGDIVECINSNRWRNIQEGGYYEVVGTKEYTGEIVVVNNVDDRCSYSTSLFRHPEIGVGDLIEGTFGYGRVKGTKISGEELFYGVVIDAYGNTLWLRSEDVTLADPYEASYREGDIVEILRNGAEARKKGSRNLYKKGDYVAVLGEVGRSVNIDGAGSDGQLISKADIQLAFRPDHPKVAKPVEVEYNQLEVFINGYRLGSFIATDDKELHLKPTLDFLESLDLYKLEDYVETHKELKLYKDLVEDSYQQYQEDLQVVDKLERELLGVFK